MRTSCPDEERIGDYINGRLNDNDNSRIEEHLSECETCRQEFIIGRRLVRGGNDLKLDPVPDNVTQSALRLVNSTVLTPERALNERCVRLFSRICSMLTDIIRTALWGRWGLATIRGSKRVVSKDLVHITRRFRDIETEIEIEKVGEAKAHIRVKLSRDNGSKGGIRVTLRKGEREVSSCLPDKRGNVLFENIPFDHYSLHLIEDGKTIGIYPFKIKEK